MPHTDTQKAIRIVFVSANPLATSRLDIEQEIRAIQQKIYMTPAHRGIELCYTSAAQPDDLRDALLRYQPHIVHFSGHGRKTGEILFRNATGKGVYPAQPHALKALFEALKGNIKLVFLNTCYSEQQAKAITEVIDCAIGMDSRLSDEAAISFAAAVYHTLGFGRSLQDAFKAGTAMLHFPTIPEYEVPQLLHRADIDPATIVLIPSSSSPSGNPIVPSSSPTPSPQQQKRRHPLLLLSLISCVLLLLGGVLLWPQLRLFSPSTPPLLSYTFEQDTQGWTTSDSDHNNSTAAISKDHVHDSVASLRVDTFLWGNKNPDNEADTPFTSTKTISPFFPHKDFAGKTFSCWLYIQPSQLKVYFRLFALTDKNDVDSLSYGGKLGPDPLAKDAWVSLSMLIVAPHTDPSNEDEPGFDPHHINQLGVLVKSAGQSSTGQTPIHFYLDDCTIT